MTLAIHQPPTDDPAARYQEFARHVTDERFLKRGDWNFKWACRFWRLNWKRCGVAIDEQLDSFARKLLFLETQAGVDPRIGRQVRELHEALLEMWHQGLEIYRRRDAQ